MISSPCAMLMMRISPKLSARPSAASSRIDATLSPSNSWPSPSASVLIESPRSPRRAAGLAGEAQRIVRLGPDRRLGAPHDRELRVGLGLADQHLLVQAAVVVEPGLAERRVELDPRRRLAHELGIERLDLLDRGLPGVDVEVAVDHRIAHHRVGAVPGLVGGDELLVAG